MKNDVKVQRKYLKICEIREKVVTLHPLFGPIESPAIDSIEVNKRGKVRRAKLYYLRALTGKKARIAEKKTVTKGAE